jgi:2-polyprenyl-6-methoxyphenol hydroxylase-like FAD-dependent oxidoreductase
MIYDLIIVGGGLAGSTLAKNMAEKGCRVLVLERETRFKDRVRGEQMHCWGVTEARTLGVYEPLLERCGHQTDWWKVYQNGAVVQNRNFKELAPHHVGSFNFYHPAMQDVVMDLAAQAGAEVRRGAAVVGLVAGAEPAVQIEANGERQTLRARLIVGADGRNSQTRGWAGFTTNRVPDCLHLVGALLEGTPIPDDAVHAVRGKDSFILIAPIGGRRARFYFIAPAGHARLTGKHDLASFVAACLESGAPPEWLEGVTAAGPIAQFNGADLWVEHPARDGVVLIGDAAGANDPSYGCGLSLALMDVRHLRDRLLATSDWRAAIDAHAHERARYYGKIRRLTQWFTELRWSTAPGADERRIRATKRFLAEPHRVPDTTVLGPEAPDDEETRRFVLEA